MSLPSKESSNNQVRIVFQLNFCFLLSCRHTFVCKNKKSLYQIGRTYNQFQSVFSKVDTKISCVQAIQLILNKVHRSSFQKCHDMVNLPMPTSQAKQIHIASCHFQLWCRTSNSYDSRLSLCQVMYYLKLDLFQILCLEPLSFERRLYITQLCLYTHRQ